MASLLSQLGDSVGQLVTQVAGSASTVAGKIQTLIGQAIGSGATSPPPAPASAPYGTIYAFGDSLTDAGNVFRLTQGQVPAGPPYSDGRFTNGPVWVQDLAQGMGLPAPGPSLSGGTDFAYGGAQTGTTPAHTATAIDLNAQLTQFAVEDPQPVGNALYAVWIGTNDVLSAQGDVLATVDAAVGNEMQFLSGLAADGARNLLVLNVPDLGITPLAQGDGPAVAAELSLSSRYYDALLNVDLQAFAAGHPDIRVTELNTFSLLDTAVSQSAAAGSPSLFVDGVHPTAQGHAMIAAAAAQALGVA